MVMMIYEIETMGHSFWRHGSSMRRAVAVKSKGERFDSQSRQATCAGILGQDSDTLNLGASRAILCKP